VPAICHPRRVNQTAVWCAPQGVGECEEKGRSQPLLRAAVGTSHGAVCVVDLEMALHARAHAHGGGDGGGEEAILRAWQPPRHIERAAEVGGGGHAALAAVQQANAIVATWRPSLDLEGGHRLPGLPWLSGLSWLSVWAWVLRVACVRDSQS
jgi:hypothetical protein